MVFTQDFTVYQRIHPLSVLYINKSTGCSLLFADGAIVECSCEETNGLKRHYEKVRDVYGCLGIIKSLHSEGVQYLILVKSHFLVGKIFESEIYRITGVEVVQTARNHLPDVDAERINEIRKILGSGAFFFSYSKETNCYDLSLNLQRQARQLKSDDRFYWNRGMQSPFYQYGIDCENWLIQVICGSIEIRTLFCHGKQARICILSRISCDRYGTRFNVRGIDDYGNCANFAETEQIIFTDSGTTSFLMLRGSVPMFWSQQGIQVGSHKIKLDRSAEASLGAFTSHFQTLKDKYGNITVLNLLGIKEGEGILSGNFKYMISELPQELKPNYVAFDFHAVGKANEKAYLLKQKVKKTFDQMGFYYTSNGEVQSLQNGFFRVNCMDCLDRTNAAQEMLAAEILPQQVIALIGADKLTLSKFAMTVRPLWKDSGNRISKMYAGTQMLEGKSKMDKVKVAASSVGRTIISNMLDTVKQEAFDIIRYGNTFSGCIDARRYGNVAETSYAYLSNKFRYHPPAYLSTICENLDSLTKQLPLRVFIGTWNVNGGKHFRSIAFRHQSMADWLVHAQDIAAQRSNRDLSNQTKPDIYAIGFEELVDLSASNILGASHTNKNEWLNELQRILNQESSYALVAVEQLVGVCLYIFVKVSLLPHIKDVAVDTVKTGLKGKAGNKGGIGIRFQLFSTTFCFICSHLAAGQNHVDDRNSDYKDIREGLTFPMYSGITSCDKSSMAYLVDSHDYVFWCGDLNYRIDLPRDEVLKMIENNSWLTMQEEDQLIKSRESGLSFIGFKEGKPDFAPTYKYDLFSDDYDTSEKQRTPAWTDRVMWKHIKNSSKLFRRFKSARSGNVSHTKSIDKLDSSSEPANNNKAVISDEPSERYDSSSDDEVDGSKTYRKFSRKLDLMNINHLEEITTSHVTESQRKEGHLVYYDRTELKTSDHRPVAAIIDVNVQNLMESDFQNYVSETNTVCQKSFPLSILVKVISDRSATNSTKLLPITFRLYTTLRRFGEIAMIRSIDYRSAIATYWNGHDAIKAAHILEKTIIDGKETLVSLRCDFRKDSEGLTYDLDDDENTVDAYEANIQDLNIPQSHLWLMSDAQEQQLQGQKKSPPVPGHPGIKRPAPAPPRPGRPPQSKSASDFGGKSSSSLNTATPVEAPRRPPPPAARPAAVPKKPPAPERPARPATVDKSIPSRPPRPNLQRETTPLVDFDYNANSNQSHQRQDYGVVRSSSDDIKDLTVWYASTMNVSEAPPPPYRENANNNIIQRNENTVSQTSSSNSSVANISRKAPPPLPVRSKDNISGTAQMHTTQFQAYNSNSSSDDEDYHRSAGKNGGDGQDMNKASQVQFEIYNSDSSDQDDQAVDLSRSSLPTGGDNLQYHKNTQIHDDDVISSSDENANPADYEFETISDNEEAMISKLNIENDSGSDISIDVDDHEISEPANNVVLSGVPRPVEYSTTNESNTNLSYGDQTDNKVGDYADARPNFDGQSEKSANARPIPVKRPHTPPKPPGWRPVPKPRPR